MRREALRKFRETVKTEPVFGLFSKTSDPGMVEVFGHAGFDFLILDMEHGPNHLETVQNLIRAAENANLLPIVRVPAKDSTLISQVLDVGAAGVQVPQISTADDLKRAVDAANFAPSGNRGVCRYVRAANYSSTEKSEYFQKANDAMMIVQLEGEEALRNLEDILNVQGADIFFIGPYDLSQSLGVTGQVEHPRVVEKMKEIAAACRERGASVGTFTESPAQTAFWVRQGLRYMSYSVDVGILYTASKQLVSTFHRECRIDR